MRSTALGGGLARGTLGREHLPDLPNTRLAVGAGLAAVLDLPERARATADLFGDAAIGDALADADEHGDVTRVYDDGVDNRFQRLLPI